MALTGKPPSNWYGALRSQSQRTVDAILEQIGEGAGTGRELGELDSSRASGARADTTSRQSRHERLRRARSRVLAAAGLLCARDSRFYRLLEDPSIGYLRPLCADTYNRVTNLVHLVDWNRPDAYNWLFERGCGHLRELYRGLTSASQREVLAMSAPLAAMFAPCVLFGEAYADRWRRAAKLLDHDGLTEHRYWRMQLALMGSYVGEPERHLQWLLDGANLDIELADTYLFVRLDTRPDLFDSQEKLLRGTLVRPADCLQPARPVSTLRCLADYILTCMRHPLHFRNAGQVLMVLVWTEALVAELARVGAEEVALGDVASVHTRLRRIQSVQIMEKRRYHDLMEGLAPGPAKAMLQRLWEQRAVECTKRENVAKRRRSTSPPTEPSGIERGNIDPGRLLEDEQAVCRKKGPPTAVHPRS